MGVMQRLAGAWNALRSGLADPQRGTMLQFIGPNNAAVRVTPEISLMVSAVWACIDCISSAISSSDWNVYAGQRGMSDQEFLPNDSLQYILNTRWNPEMTAQSAKRAAMIAALGWGNGYAEIVPDGAGRIAQLWPIEPDRAELRRNRETGRMFLRVFNSGAFRFSDAGGFVDLDMADVFHIRGPGISGLLGDSMFAKSVQTIAMSVALDQFGASYFANGTQMGVVLEYPNLGKMDDATYDRMKKSFEERHRGARKAFRVGFMDGGMKLHQLQVDADKAQLIEAKYQQIEEVCRWFHVPPHKIAHLLRATNNNIEHQGLEFTRDTLRPWRIEIEQEADYKLVPARGQKKFVCIDVDWAAEGDFKTRMEGYQIGRNIGVYSANDILRKLGDNTIGSDGDIRIVNGAAIPLGRVGENYSATRASDAGGNGGIAPGSSEGDAAAPMNPAAQNIVRGLLQSVFARIHRRQESRLADLRKGGKEGADAAARADAIDYAEKAVAELRASFAAWDDFELYARWFAGRVITGEVDAAAAADGLLRKMREAAHEVS